MNIRTYLKAAGTTAIVGVTGSAGCTAPLANEETPTPTETDTPTATPTETNDGDGQSIRNLTSNS